MADWAAIVERHGPAVWRTAFRVLGRRADAEDVYQDVFIHAFQASGVRDWGAFLGALAARRAIDCLRSRSRRRDENVPAEAFDPAPDPCESAAGVELLERVRELLTRLPARQAEAFWLTAIEGWSAPEAAAQLGTSPGATRVLIHRARTSLAAALAPTRSEP